MSEFYLSSNWISKEDVLDIHIFENVNQVKEKTEEFIMDYNNFHLHDSISNLSPVQFLKTKYQKKMSNFTL
jgi:putative transposase